MLKNIIRDYYFNKSLDHVRNFSNKKAIKCINKILRFKTDFDVLCFKGLYYSNLFEKEKCFECFDIIFNIDPDYINGHYYKGMACFTLNEFEEAILCFKKVLEVYPENLMTLNEIGRCYTYLEEYDLAFKYFNKVLDEDNENIDALLNLSSTYNYLEEFDKSLEYLNKCLVIDPDNPLAFQQMGNVYKNKKDYSKALDCINKAIENYYTDLIFKSSKSLFLAYNEEYELSLRGFREISEMDFDFWDMINLFYLDFALALSLMKKYDEALAVCDEYLEKYPNFPTEDILHEKEEIIELMNQ